MTRFTWREVIDIAEAIDLTGLRGYPCPGIRIRLVDGTTQDVCIVAPRAIRAAHPDATRAGAVAVAMMDARGGGAPHLSRPT